jgi:hypothetical protein
MQIKHPEPQRAQQLDRLRAQAASPVGRVEGEADGGGTLRFGGQAGVADQGGGGEAGDR